MNVKISLEALKAICDILKNGDKAVIQRRGNDVIVMEEKRKIKYGDASPIRAK